MRKIDDEVHLPLFKNTNRSTGKPQWQYVRWVEAVKVQYVLDEHSKIKPDANGSRYICKITRILHISPNKKFEIVGVSIVAPILKAQTGEKLPPARKRHSKNRLTPREVREAHGHKFHIVDDEAETRADL